MNLMFRKNFAAEKAPSTETRSGICGSYATSSGTGLGGSSMGPGGARLGIRPSIVPGSGRGPIRRSREFGYYPMDEQPSHAYRTHLFLSPTAGAAGAEETTERLGPGPRRNSGPHVIKWGGTGGNTTTTALGPNKRKQSNSAQNKDSTEPVTPTASRQVK